MFGESKSTSSGSKLRWRCTGGWKNESNKRVRCNAQLVTKVLNGCKFKRIEFFFSLKQLSILTFLFEFISDEMIKNAQNIIHPHWRLWKSLPKRFRPIFKRCEYYIWTENGPWLFIWGIKETYKIYWNQHTFDKNFHKTENEQNKIKTLWRKRTPFDISIVDPFRLNSWLLQIQ